MISMLSYLPPHKTHENCNCNTLFVGISVNVAMSVNLPANFKAVARAGFGGRRSCHRTARTRSASRSRSDVLIVHRQRNAWHVRTREQDVRTNELHRLSVHDGLAGRLQGHLLQCRDSDSKVTRSATKHAKQAALNIIFHGSQSPESMAT